MSLFTSFALLFLFAIGVSVAEYTPNSDQIDRSALTKTRSRGFKKLESDGIKGKRTGDGLTNINVDLLNQDRAILDDLVLELQHEAEFPYADTFNFFDNRLVTPFASIPPDTHGAVGHSVTVSAVNVAIEIRDKNTHKRLAWRGLSEFYGLDATTNDFVFDPKVVYDTYEDRFVVVVILADFVVSTNSILFAVSKDGEPKTLTSDDWYLYNFEAVQPEASFSQFPNGSFSDPFLSSAFADYPQVGFSKEAIYVTCNYFPFSFFGFAPRTAVLSKEGFYDGARSNPPQRASFNPYYNTGLFNSASSGIFLAMAPARNKNQNRPGTYTVGYDGLNNGTHGYLEVWTFPEPDQSWSRNARVGPLLNLPVYVIFPGIDNWASPMVNAPQLGSDVLISVIDRRVLEVVVVEDLMYVTSQIVSFDLRALCAVWIIDLKVVDQTPGYNVANALVDYFIIDGADLGSNENERVFTYYPSIDVNAEGDIQVSFQASSQFFYGGFYTTLIQASDVGHGPSQPRKSFCVKEGEDFYERDFGGSRNRWGDYSATQVDPSDDNTFWGFGQYAAPRATAFFTRGFNTPVQDGVSQSVTSQYIDYDRSGRKTNSKSSSKGKGKGKGKRH